MDEFDVVVMDAEPAAELLAGRGGSLVHDRRVWVHGLEHGGTVRAEP